MTSDGANLFNMLIHTQEQPANQYQALNSAPSNALAQGNVLLKITCGDEIRCRSVSEDYGWEDLQYTVQQMFAQEISPRDPIQLRFRDAEGDWVTMGSEDEYNLAKQLSPKLHICVSQKQLPRQNLNIPQIRKALVRLREEINSLLEVLPTQGAKEDPPEPTARPNPQPTPRPTPQPQESKKQNKETPPIPDSSLVNSVLLDTFDESKIVRTVSPQQLPVAPIEPPRQYSNLGKLPTNIMPNSGQPYAEYGLEGASKPAAQHPIIPSSSTLPSAPSSVPSASTLFPTQSIPFSVPQAPYPPQGYAPPQQPPVPPFSTSFYPSYYSK